LTSIGYSAFKNCSSLALTLLPSGLTSIGGEAFSGCTSLRNILIACKTLGTGAKIFSGCTGLERVWIRDSCTTISAASAANAPFVNCSTSLKIYAEPSAKKSGWGIYYNRTGSNGGTTATVTFNQTTQPW
jgi:hypothetical protein